MVTVTDSWFQIRDHVRKSFPVHCFVHFTNITEGLDFPSTAVIVANLHIEVVGRARCRFISSLVALSLPGKFTYPISFEHAQNFLQYISNLSFFFSLAASSAGMVWQMMSFRFLSDQKSLQRNISFHVTFEYAEHFSRHLTRSSYRSVFFCRK